MTTRLNRMFLSGLLFTRAVTPKTSLLARPVSTISDLFEYTSGRWMYVTG